MSNYFIQKDKTLARKAEGGGFLQGNQAHVVKITQAYYSVNDKGTQSLNLSLVNADGDKGDIRLHFANDGGELPDYNKIMAILELTNVEGISQNTGTYEAYDFDQGGRVVKQGLVAPELLGKFVGVVLSYNYYQNQNGEVKYNLALFGLYHAKTLQTVKQYQDNQPAKEGQVDDMVQKAIKSSEKSQSAVDVPRPSDYSPSNYPPNSYHANGYQNNPPSPNQTPPRNIGGGLKEMEAMGKAPATLQGGNQVTDEAMPF